MKPAELSIGTEIFTDLRIKLDTALNAVVSNLISKDLGSGKVTARIGVEIFKKTDKETGEIYYEPVFKPEVSLNIGGRGKMDCSAPVGLILKKSKCGRNFIGTNQITMNDMLDDQEQEEA